MGKITDLLILKEHAECINMHDKEIHSELAASVDVLKKYLIDNYIGKFLKTESGFLYINSIEKVEAFNYCNDRTYSTRVNADLYHIYVQLDKVLISYKERSAFLSFDLTGKPQKHTLADDNFNLDNYCIIGEDEIDVLNDFNHDLLSPGDKVNVVNNFELTEGTVIQFDTETKKIEVGVPDATGKYFKIPSNCLILKRK
ncbi:MAG: hypothetical protein [Wendovervirus sonii]|uniref:Uncharacterized protein n=1 Tax=phage Lak_Megaphage_Sonny TaxID=3109229 RepID=A0ABZ0Z6E9_9CAUD|nr:MAG: hypothetical protein [phage Lak_Megaphage_Sonny]